jgi:hypothetical protein
VSQQRPSGRDRYSANGWPAQFAFQLPATIRVRDEDNLQTQALCGALYPQLCYSALKQPPDAVDPKVRIACTVETASQLQKPQLPGPWPVARLFKPLYEFVIIRLET